MHEDQHPVLRSEALQLVITLVVLPTTMQVRARLPWAPALNRFTSR
jgi:hypothetical protein